MKDITDIGNTENPRIKESIQTGIPGYSAVDGQKFKKPGKGIQTMLRLSFSNHKNLSYMADQKANIMISVNTIILSAVISLLLRHLDQATYLLVPTCMLLAVSLTTIVFALLATRPTVPRGIFTQEELDGKKVNFHFFGNYYKMPLKDYKTGMGHLMEDMDYLYGSMIEDGYAQAKVLGRKYSLLRHSYNVFMYGLIVTVIAFIVVSLF